MSAEQPNKAELPQGQRLLGQVTLPLMAGRLDTLWSLILDFAERVPSGRWLLIGGCIPLRPS